MKSTQGMVQGGVQMQLDGNVEVLGDENSDITFGTIQKPADDKSDHLWLNNMMKLMNVCPNCQCENDRVPGHEWPTPDIAATRFLVERTRVLGFIFRRWVRNFNMPEVVVIHYRYFGSLFKFSSSCNDFLIISTASCYRVLAVNSVWEYACQLANNCRE